MIAFRASLFAFRFLIFAVVASKQLSVGNYQSVVGTDYQQLYLFCTDSIAWSDGISYNLEKTMIKNIIILLILSVNCFAATQQADEQLLRQQEQDLASQMQAAVAEKSKLIRQGDSLAALIQELKQKKSLSIFQRQRLEDLLRSSQQLEQQIFEIDQKIVGLNKQHQSLLKQLVAYYDREIDELVARQKNEILPPARQKVLYQSLTSLKADRDRYLKKIKPDLINVSMQGQIRIEATDSYQAIKQKADLLKDQEDKIRRQMNAVEKKVADLKNELKLRNRLNELISDTYLLDKPNETLIRRPAQLDATRESEQTFNTLKNSELQNMSLSDISNFLITTEVNEISHLDLEYYIKDLNQVKTMLKRSADSLAVAADKFYQAAEQKRKEVHK